MNTNTADSLNADVLGDFLDRAQAKPVLVDVGASGARHAPWQPVAHKSVFVGFDPDHRDLDPALGRTYAACHIIPKIVAGPDAPRRTPFVLTRFPHCSSMLEPDAAALEPYIFADLFTVERRVELETITLAQSMDDLKIAAIDWLKVDSQGCDLSIIMGLDPARRTRLLCVEIEPGLSAFYRGEQTFCDLHAALTAQGFWLAHLKCQQFPRVRATTVKDAFGIDLRATDPAASLFGASPTAVEARYFPTLAALAVRNATVRDYAVVWSFAAATGLWGYALEIAQAILDTGAHSDLGRFMRDSVKATVGAMAMRAQRGA